MLICLRGALQAGGKVAQRGIDYCHRLTQTCSVQKGRGSGGKRDWLQQQNEQRVRGTGLTSVSQEFQEIFGGRTRKALCGAGQLIVRQLGGGRRAWVQASQV